MTRPLSPEIVAAIDAALSDLENTHPGASTDLDLRREVDAAVSAAVASLERLVPEVTETDTMRAMAALQPAEDPSDAESRRVMEAFGLAAMRRATERVIEALALEPAATRRATRRVMEEMAAQPMNRNNPLSGSL
jgi:uncharacterized protein YicC (UPF0701 family)